MLAGIQINLAMKRSLGNLQIELDLSVFAKPCLLAKFGGIGEQRGE